LQKEFKKFKEENIWLCILNLYPSVNTYVSTSQEENCSALALSSSAGEAG
jgi:hypothetical protein